MLLFGLADIFNFLPPLSEEKNPWIAFLVSFFFGFLGLGIYFRTFADFFFPTLVTTIFLAGVVTIPAIPFITGMYGYFRAVSSNDRW